MHGRKLSVVRDEDGDEGSPVIRTGAPNVAVSREEARGERDGEGNPLPCNIEGGGRKCYVHCRRWCPYQAGCERHRERICVGAFRHDMSTTIARTTSTVFTSQGALLASSLTFG